MNTEKAPRNPSTVTLNSESLAIKMPISFFSSHGHRTWKVAVCLACSTFCLPDHFSILYSFSYTSFIALDHMPSTVSSLGGLSTAPPRMPPSSTADCAPGSLLPPTPSAPIVTFSCFRNHVAGLSLLRCLRSLVCSLPMTLPSAPPRSLPPTVTLGHSATTLPPNSRFQGCHSLTTTCCVPDHSLLWP